MMIPVLEERLKILSKSLSVAELKKDSRELAREFFVRMEVYSLPLRVMRRGEALQYLRISALLADNLYKDGRCANYFYSECQKATYLLQKDGG